MVYSAGLLTKGKKMSKSRAQTDLLKGTVQRLFITHDTIFSPVNLAIACCLAASLALLSRPARLSELEEPDVELPSRKEIALLSCSTTVSRGEKGERVCCICVGVGVGD